jgi:hypothetical protein
MAKFNVDADIREINRYEFTVEAESPEKAEIKLLDYLRENIPHPLHTDEKWGISCDDRESAVTTDKIILVTVK